MSLITINKDPSKNELRWFGVMFVVFFAAIGLVAWFLWEKPVLAKWIWSIAGGLSVVYTVVPAFRRVMYLGWLYAAYPIGWTVSHILMGSIYYLLMTPIGLIMRLVGYDPMRKSFDKDAKSYWQDHSPAKDKRAYFRQF